MTEVKIDRVVSADSSSKEDKCPVPVNGNENEAVPAEMDEENSGEESMNTAEQTPVEKATTSEPGENSRNEFMCVHCIITSVEMDVKINEVSCQPVSHKESAMFEINSNDDDDDDDGPPRLHLDTLERQNTSPTQKDDKAEGEESIPTAAEKKHSYEERMQLYQELCENRDQVCQNCSLLQMKLAELIDKKIGEDTQLEREVLMPEQLQEYEKYINILTDVKQQITDDSETAQQQTEGLRLQSQEKLSKVENEWRALVALKEGVAVSVLSQRLGKQATQAKVETTLATEKFLQDRLVKLRLRHIKLCIKIHRLEAELCKWEEHAWDPLRLQFEQLQAEKLELKKQTEKQNEESLKMQKKISSSLEILSNVKEKLFRSQMEVQTKREQLAKVEDTVARKRDLLTRTRQARNGLQKENLHLKEHRGLLGKRVLLQDFQDTVDVCDQLKKQLENLKCAEIF